MLKDNLKRADVYLLVLFVAYCIAVVLRVIAEGTGYTSPDSEYYLEAARSIVNGEGLIIRDLYGLHTGHKNAHVLFTAWPLGYPALIAAITWVSGLNLFWASKAVNLLFAGLGFLLMRQLSRQYAYILASVYGVFTVIEMYSYTWSECVFIFGCLCFVVSLAKVHSSGKGIWFFILFGVAAFMFLIRYIGFFAGGVILLFTLWAWFEKRKETSVRLLLVFCLNVALVCGYVLMNHYLAGYNTDMQRVSKDIESPLQILWMAIKGLTIELFLIKNYYLKGTPDALTVATALLQIAVLMYVWLLLRKQAHTVFTALKYNHLSHIALITAGSYLVVLVFLRSISQFDPINYRLLSPFAFLILFALVHYIVALPDHIRNAKKVKHLVFGFMVVSLMVNLPKKFLLAALLSYL